MTTKIFVFGSNEAGRHGAGAARTARIQYGAVYSIGYGHTGDCFAIPTLDVNLKPLPTWKLPAYINGFLAYASGRPDLDFIVTRVGCGLAGLTDGNVAPLFRDSSDNVQFDEAWKPWLEDGVSYWGTFP